MSLYAAQRRMDSAHLIGGDDQEQLYLLLLITGFAPIKRNRVSICCYYRVCTNQKKQSFVHDQFASKQTTQTGTVRVCTNVTPAIQALPLVRTCRTSLFGVLVLIFPLAQRNPRNVHLRILKNMHVSLTSFFHHITSKTKHTSISSISISNAT
mmetsp:Transcript_32411/g.49043  ORF Transcript_32411/g.49043 Transcript_32411/m.49043 type:complete len:153 (-) Transcript_32411:672-1130(-)